MSNEPIGELPDVLQELGEIDPIDTWEGDDLTLDYLGWTEHYTHGIVRDREGSSINTCGEPGCHGCALMVSAMNAGFLLDEVIEHIDY